MCENLSSRNNSARRSFSSMSGNNLTEDGELRYIIQWFNQWSDLQRDDFLPILVEYLLKGSPQVYMNGTVSGMAATTCSNKPMSLFQCRIKLFKEWSPKWPEEFKGTLKEKCIEIDPKFGERLAEELSSVFTNGNSVSPTPAEIESTPADDVETPPEPSSVADEGGENIQIA